MAQNRFSDPNPYFPTRTRIPKLRNPILFLFFFEFRFSFSKFPNLSEREASVRQWRKNRRLRNQTLTLTLKPILRRRRRRRRRRVSTSSAKCAIWTTIKASDTSTFRATRVRYRTFSLGSKPSTPTFASSSRTLALSVLSSPLKIGSGASFATPTLTRSAAPSPGTATVSVLASFWMILLNSCLVAEKIRGKEERK